MRPAALLLLSALALAACADTATTDDPGSDSAEVTEADKALIAFGTASQHSLYVRLPAKPSKELTTAMIDAAKRGVDTRAVLFASDDFDSNWMLQQHLESSGVDVDVRKDKPLETVLAFSDDAALLPAKSGTKRITGERTIAATFEDDARGHL